MSDKGACVEQRVSLLARSLYLTAWASNNPASVRPTFTYGLTHVDEYGDITLITYNDEEGFWETRCEYFSAPSIREDGSPYLGYWHLLTFPTHDSYSEIPSATDFVTMLLQYLSLATTTSADYSTISFFLRFMTYIQLNYGLVVLMDNTTHAAIDSQANQTLADWTTFIAVCASDFGRKWESPVGRLYITSEAGEAPYWILRQLQRNGRGDGDVFEKAAIAPEVQGYPGYFPGGKNRCLV